MNNLKKIVIIGICIILSVFLLYQLMTIHHSFLSDNENNVVMAVTDSPNGKYKAVVFERNIDATTKTSYHLSILKNSEDLNGGAGNVFVSYYDFNVEWENDNTLKVINHPENNKLKKRTQYGAISIVYLN